MLYFGDIADLSFRYGGVWTIRSVDVLCEGVWVQY